MESEKKKNSGKNTNITKSCNSDQQINEKHDEKTNNENNENNDNNDNNDNNELNMTIDQILTNLKIISKIKKGEKMITNNMIMEIDNRYLQWFRRWWEQNSRISTVDFFNKILERAFQIIDETYDNKDQKNYYFNEENSRILQKFSLELTNARQGLNNLKETYTDDETTKSQLDIMDEKINQRIEKIQKILTIQGNYPEKS